MLKRILVMGIVCVFTLSLLGCHHRRFNESKVIIDVLKKLAPSFELGNKLLPFGLSNTFGPGAVYRNFSDGGRQIVYKASDYLTPLNSYVSPGAKVLCSYKLDNSKNNKLVLGFLSLFSSNFQAFADKARKITIEAKYVAWDNLKLGMYEQYLKGLSNNNHILNAFSSGDFVMTRALRVKGLKATFEFKANVGTDLKANSPELQIATSDGSGTIDLEMKWTSSRVVTIEVPDDIYLAGEFHKVSIQGTNQPIVTKPNGSSIMHITSANKFVTSNKIHLLLSDDKLDKNTTFFGTKRKVRKR